MIRDREKKHVKHHNKNEIRSKIIIITYSGVYTGNQ